MSDLRRFDDLMSRYLDASLDDGEQRELADLARVPGNAAILFEVLRMDRQISGLLSAPSKSETMARSVLDDIRRADEAGSSGRRLFAKSITPRIRRRRAQRDWSRVTAASLAAACIAIFFFWRQTSREMLLQPVGSVAAVDAAASGAIRIQAGGQLSARLSVGMALHAGDRIEAFGDAGAAWPQTAAALRLFDGAAVQMGEGAILMIQNGGDEPVVRLETGRLFIESSSLSRSGRHLRVRSPCGDVLCLGTRFEVFAGKDVTTVIVEAGRVALSNALGEQRLQALETSRAQAGTAPSEPTTVAASDIWRGVDSETAENPRDGLVAYWPLDEANGLVANDASPGGGHSATLRNGAAWTQGRLGGALSLDGIDDYAEFAPMPLAGDFTMSVWVWSERIAGAEAIIGNAQHSTALGYDDWDVPNGCIRFGSDGGTWVRWGVRPPLREWHHIAVVYNHTGGMAELTLDGQRCGAQALRADFVTSNYPLRYFGTSYLPDPDRTCFFQGRIDDARIYDRILSEQEILVLYHMDDGLRGQP
jgi:ferric-dicitrate binding protein FerR (iron transport regulator)